MIKIKNILLAFIFFLLLGCQANLNDENIELKEEKTEPKADEKIELTNEDYENNGVDELGEVPIMMYHGIRHMSNSDTNYTGGNIDSGGYQRTTEAFSNDLEFYYKSGYRMIRLTDFVDGKIDVELGKSPIILTFDDGAENINVTGLDKNGNIIIDPNCAVGILESFKKKYPDYHVTATFFLNASLFGQKEYNEKILKWLINNGYDIGNHTYSHVDFTKVDSRKAIDEVGSMYEILDSIIPDKYVNIIALPYGSPYELSHENMKYIYDTEYNGKKYTTKSTLRVGWKAQESPFHKDFNPKFLKRIRAYDNDGKEFDIEMNFKLLEKNRYISDGEVDTIVIPNSRKNLLKSDINNFKNY